MQNHETNQKILELDFTGFPYLALWSKKGAPFVCIEPWQNTADRIDSTQIYKDKENIIELPKDKEMVMPGDNVTIKAKLITPIAIEKGLKFAIREGGRTVGSGSVSNIIE